MEDWTKCTRCCLHKFRRQVVLGKGATPADVMFIGEAPGKSEDLRGEPFIGPSGRLLCLAIRRATYMARIDTTPSIYLTNVCACRPTDKKNGPNRQPTSDEMWACHQRLQDEVEMVRPKRIIFLGKVAATACKALYPGGTPQVHPAYLLRQGGERSSEFLRFVRELSKVFEGMNYGYGQTKDMQKAKRKTATR